MKDESTEVAAPLTSIVEYSKTAAALADLNERYKDVLFDVTTKEGMAAAIKGRAEIRGYRVTLEKTRVEIKAPALKRTQEIDSEARRIEGALLALEEPIDDQIKADARRKAAEAEAAAKAEADRLAAEEAARKAAEEAVLKAQRAEIERQQAELAARQRVQAEIEAAARRKIEQEQQAARDKIAAEQRAAQAERDEADRQARLAQQARDEVARVKAAQEAERLQAEHREQQRILDEQAAKIRAEQAAEAKRVREAQEKVDAERREVEEAARKERQAQEDRQREARRVENERLDGRAILVNFRDQYGKIEEFAPVVKAINQYLKGLKEAA